MQGRDIKRKPSYLLTVVPCISMFICFSGFSQAEEAEQKISINELFENSMLAVASYAKFPDGEGGDEILKDYLDNLDFAEGWAGDANQNKRRMLTDRFSLLHHETDTEVSDFSVTLFKRKSDGQITFASRGTEPGYDIWEDIVGITAIGVPYNQVRDLHNYVQRLKTPSGRNEQYVNLTNGRNKVV